MTGPVLPHDVWQQLMVCVSQSGGSECRSAELQPKGLGRQTRSDDSGARNWGLLREWNLCDAIKQEQLEVACYYLPCLPAQGVY